MSEQPRRVPTRDDWLDMMIDTPPPTSDDPADWIRYHKAVAYTGHLASMGEFDPKVLEPLDKAIDIHLRAIRRWERRARDGGYR